MLSKVRHYRLASDPPSQHHQSSPPTPGVRDTQDPIRLEKALGPGLDIPTRYYMLHRIVVLDITPLTLTADTKRRPGDLDIRLLLWSEKEQVPFNEIIPERT